MINVPYTLECSQYWQRISEWKGWTFQGYCFLFPNCRFQCRCRSLGCLLLHCHLHKLSLWTFYSSFVHGSILSILVVFFFTKSLITFLLLIKPLSTLNSAPPSRNVFNERALVTSSLCGSSTYSTSSAMFVTRIMLLFRSNCPRGVQNRISLEVKMLCNKPETRSLGTAWDTLLKTSLILGSSSSFSSWQLPLSSFSLSSTKSRSVPMESEPRISNI